MKSKEMAITIVMSVVLSLIGVSALVLFDTPIRDGLRGPQGEQGIQGIEGEKGDTGPKGETGLQGETGPPGEFETPDTYTYVVEYQKSWIYSTNRKEAKELTLYSEGFNITSEIWEVSYTASKGLVELADEFYFAVDVWKILDGGKILIPWGTVNLFGEQGKYRMTLMGSGQYEIVIRHSGYQGVTVLVVDHPEVM